MQKKKIIIFILIILLISILLIIGINSRKMNLIDKTGRMEYTTTIVGQEFDITNQVQDPSKIKPSLSAGMIPVKWNGENWVITTREDWYDYANSKPAYIMLNDGTYQSELVQNMTGKKLAKVGNEVNPNDLGSIYMWLPRFAYNDKGEIIYIKQECTVAGTWEMEDIFEYQVGAKNYSLSGIWIEYNKLTNANQATTKVSKLNEGKYGDTFGFLANVEAYKVSGHYSNPLQIFIASISNENDTFSFIDSPENTNRTMLNVFDETKVEPVHHVYARYNVETSKIDIEALNSKNGIKMILNSKGEVLSENSSTANSGNEQMVHGRTYTYTVIDNLGNIMQASTTLNIKDIITIANLSQLQAFRDNVNNGNTYAGKTIYQIADIEGIGDWTPIGIYSTTVSNQKPFCGTYDGRGHTLSGLRINKTGTTAASNYQGLFGYIHGGTVRNVILGKEYDEDKKQYDGYITGNQYVGGIVGYTDSAYIYGCTNNIPISVTTNYGGGIVGYAKTIKATTSVSATTVTINNCTNNAGVGKEYFLDDNGTENTKNVSNLGGIVGYAYGNDATSTILVTNCTNNKGVSGYRYIGGIIGDGKVVTITGCTNNKDIIGDNQYVGGIIGRDSGVANVTLKLENCTNKAIIKGTGYIGGIAGYATNITSIANCKNEKDVMFYTEAKTTGNYLGGIVGYTNVVSSITGCINDGKVYIELDGWGISKDGSTVNHAGGIVGYLNSGTVEIKKCGNNGAVDINGNDAGGIIGGNNGTSYCTIEESYNNGNIYAKGYAAGISSLSGTKSIKNCYNDGFIASYNAYAFGIANITSSSYTIENCYNNGSVYAGYGVTNDEATNNNASCAYGISRGGTITACYNTGYVEAIFTYAYGIGGNTVTNCFNSGDVRCAYSFGITTATGQNSRIAGITESGIVTNCFNTGYIFSNNYTGDTGYIGGICSNGGTITACYNTGGISKSKAYDTPNVRIGGISGNGGTIKNCYNTGEVGTSLATSSEITTIDGKGIVGYSGSLTNNYYLANSNDSTNNNKQMGVSAQTMKTRDFLTNLNASAIYYKEDKLNINNGYPILSWQTDNDELKLINGDNAFTQDANRNVVLAWE